MANVRTEQNQLEETFWALIDERRQAREVSRRSFAGSLGVSHQTMGRYFRGEMSAPLATAAEASRQVGLTFPDALRIVEDRVMRLQAEEQLKQVDTQAITQGVADKESTTGQYEQAFDTTA